MKKIEIAEFHYSSHAIQRMFERGLYPDDDEKVIKEWNIINEYPDDKPFPSVIFLGSSDENPIHVVAGIDDEHNLCYIITVYHPDPDLWSDDFRRRR